MELKHIHELYRIIGIEYSIRSCLFTDKCHYSSKKEMIEDIKNNYKNLYELIEKDDNKQEIIDSLFDFYMTLNMYMDR